MDRPNILLICADMIGARHLGCYGDPVGATPNLDGMAAAGTVLEQAHCACSPCIPARASLMTGLYAHTHGKTAHVQMPLRPEPPLLPALLAQHGYRTGLVGKTHWWPPAHSLGCVDTHLTIDNHLTPELGEHDAYVAFLAQRGIYRYEPHTWSEGRQRLAPDNLPPDCLKVNWTGDTACALLQRYLAADGPFFLLCSFVEPHGAGSVQTSYLERFAAEHGPPPAPAGQSTGHPASPPAAAGGAAPGQPSGCVDRAEAEARGAAPSGLASGVADAPDTDPTSRPSGPAGAASKVTFRIRDRAAGLHSGGVTHAQMQRYRLGVYASMSLVDRNIGKLLAALEHGRAARDTVVIFTSDHGDLMYDHGLVEKTFLYDGAVRVPLILRGPGIPDGVRLPQLASHIDVMPTVLDLCGVERQALTLEGRSLLPLLQDRSALWRQAVFSAADQTVHLGGLVRASSTRMVRCGPWKFLHTLTDGWGLDEELYHVVDDPGEQCDRAQDPACLNVVADLRDRLLRWLVATEPHRLHPTAGNRYPVPRFGQDEY